MTARPARSTVSLVLLTIVSLLSAPAFAQLQLAPHQQAALDRILAPMDEPTRVLMRDQLATTLSTMSEEQVRLMLAAMADEPGGDTDPLAGSTPDAEPEAARVATEEDLAYNRAQYEPAIRRAWAAEKAFDDFVEARLAADCPAAGTVAVFGQAWRYELAPLDPVWPRASASADLDVQILGASYAPRDGRYRFDFTRLEDSFDAAAVGAAIARACAGYREIGEQFMADARDARRADTLPGGDALQALANARVGPLREQLEQVLQREAPLGSGALHQALLGATRID